MAATSAQIERLRRMVAEPDQSGDYTNTTLRGYIEAAPMFDTDGNEPTDDDWVETYDLNAVAAQIWEEKAAVVAQDYTYSADGASYNRSDVYSQYMKHARRYASKRNPTTIRAVQWPPPNRAEVEAWIGNAAEEDD